MRTKRHFLLTAMMMLTSLVSNAYDFKVDGIYYDILSEEDLIVYVDRAGSSASASRAYKDSVVIPETVVYNDITYSVKGIKPSAFSGSYLLTSINIPNSVVEIGSSAFNNCTSLTSITIPNSVTEIEHLTFAYCSGLTTINIPNSVAKIGMSAFEGCTSLTSITIPNSVTEIEHLTFAYCI